MSNHEDGRLGYILALIAILLAFGIAGSMENGNYEAAMFLFAVLIILIVLGAVAFVIGKLPENESPSRPGKIQPRPVRRPERPHYRLPFVEQYDKDLEENIDNGTR